MRNDYTNAEGKLIYFEIGIKCFVVMIPDQQTIKKGARRLPYAEGIQTGLTNQYHFSGLTEFRCVELVKINSAVQSRCVKFNSMSSH